jgi:pimeloyl-ACP methyl ester carboxylesterase
MTKVIVGLVAAYLVLLVGTYAVHARLILPGRREATATTPSAVGLPFEDLEIPVGDGTHVHAWWVSAERPSRKVILYFHGNYEDLDTEATVEAPLLHETGANVLLVDYRGYGSSSPLQANGRTTEADARAALRYLMDQRHVALSDVVLGGRSIGAAVATQLALESPGAAGLFLVTPITSVSDVANQSWAFRYVLRPVEWLTRADNFDSESKISSIHMPVLIIAGSRDVLARPWMAERIFARANEPKSLDIVDGADHNDIMERRDPQVQELLRVFVDTIGLR